MTPVSSFQVNSIIRQHADTAPESEADYHQPMLSPITGNVAFAASQYSLCFTLKSFAQLYKTTYAHDAGSDLFNEKELAKRLWGDVYFNRQTRRFQRQQTAAATRSFVQFILEPVYKVFAQVVGDVDVSLEGLCDRLGIEMNARERRLNIRPLLRLVWQKYTGSFNGFVDMCVEHLPSPLGNAPNKVRHCYTGPEAAARGMIECDAESPLYVHTAKNYATPDGAQFHVLGRVFGGTVHEGERVRVLGEAFSLQDEEDSQELRCGRLWLPMAR